MTIRLEDEDQKSIARAMVEQRMDTLATAAYRLASKAIETAVAGKIAQECQDLCSPKRNSLLRRSSVTDLTLFSQAQFIEELASVAPTFYTMLCASTGFQPESNEEGSHESHSHIPAYSHMTSAVACLMFYRNQRMSAFQHLVGSILRESGAKKMAFKRLNNMGLCMSSDSVCRKAKEMIGTFDERVKCWKKSVEKLAGHAVDNEGSDSDSSEATNSDSSEATILLDDDDDDDDTGNMGDHTEPRDSQSNEKQPHTSHLPYFQIVGDNIDFEVKAKFMTLSQRNRSLHWFNMVAVDERVCPPEDLSNERPTRSILSVSETAFLPSPEELQRIRDEFIMLFARSIVTYLKDFSIFRSSVHFHLPHDHSNEAVIKSSPVPLGIVEWNENKQTDMIEILKYVQRLYVPYSSHSPAAYVQFSGDQLTAERSRNALKSLVDSSAAADRVEGIIPHAEDFHCSMNFLDLIFKKFYSNSSGYSDPGTLLNIKALLGRRNVTSDPLHNFTPCNSFLEDVVDSHILAIAMHHFGMKDPSQRGIVESIPEENREEWFLGAVGEMVDVFVHRRLKSDLDKLVREVQEVLDGSTTGTSRKKGGKQPRKRVAANDYVDCTEPVTVQGAERVLFQCHHPFCTETFPSTEDRERHVSVVHSGYTIIDHDVNAVTTAGNEVDRSGSASAECVDGVFNYAANLMTMALIEKDFKDASREMDGPRLFRLWKLKLLFFKDAGRTKYALEGLYFQADQYALLSAQQAYRQLWNRGFNTKGGEGNNIALDLMVEHRNNYLKDMVSHQGANFSFK